MGKSTMETKICKRCKKDISHRYHTAKYCETCAEKTKTEYNKEYIKKYDKQFPRSARGKYRKYYKFLLTLTEDELSALYSAKQHTLKNPNINKRTIKAQIVLINEAYKRKGGE